MTRRPKPGTGGFIEISWFLSNFIRMYALLARVRDFQGVAA